MHIVDIIPIAMGVFFIWVGIRLVKKKDTTDADIRQWRQGYPTATAKITGTYRNYDYKNNRHSSYYKYTADILVNGVWHKARGIDSFGAEQTCSFGEELTVAYRPIVRKPHPVMESIAHRMLDVLLTAMLGGLGLSGKKEELLRFDNTPEYTFKILDAEKFQNERIQNSKPDGAGIFFICFGAAILLIALLAATGILG